MGHGEIMGIIHDQTLDAIVPQQLKEQIFAFTPASSRSEAQSGQQMVPQRRFTRVILGGRHGQPG